MCKKIVMCAIFMSSALASVSVNAVTRLRCRAVVRRGASVGAVLVPLVAYAEASAYSDGNHLQRAAMEQQIRAENCLWFSVIGCCAFCYVLKMVERYEQRKAAQVPAVPQVQQVRRVQPLPWRVLRVAQAAVAMPLGVLKCMY